MTTEIWIYWRAGPPFWAWALTCTTKQSSLCLSFYNILHNKEWGPLLMLVELKLQMKSKKLHTDSGVETINMAIFPLKYRPQVSELLVYSWGTKKLQLLHKRMLQGAVCPIRIQNLDLIRADPGFSFDPGFPSDPWSKSGFFRIQSEFSMIQRSGSGLVWFQDLDIGSGSGKIVWIRHTAKEITWCTTTVYSQKQQKTTINILENIFY